MSHANEVPAIDAMAELESLRQQNQALREELDETNQGVLALYAELDQQAEQLRDVSELKSRFLSYMSHEFRTPLGSILSITRRWPPPCLRWPRTPPTCCRSMKWPATAIRSWLLPSPRGW